ALPGADGSVDLFYRAQGAARLTAVPAGAARDVPGFDGYGRVSAAGSPLGPVLLGRTRGGRLQLRTGGSVSVRGTGPVALDGAVLHIGAGGRPAVVGLGPDALPWVWRP
ncbi:MAG TPA: PIG-L family deacetylase, partial [Streptomyces sp.]